MSKFAKGKSRLGRGLSSLIPESEGAVPQTQLRSAADETVIGQDSTPSSGVDLAKPEAQDAAKSLAGDLSASIHDGSLIFLHPKDVAPNPHQPRRVMDQALLAELAASFRTTGIIQPVIVRPVGDGYELVAGERRWRAAQLAGLDRIPAVLRQVEGSRQAEMALIENTQRVDLNPIDRAEAYRALMEQLGLTQAELAERLGEDRSSLANYLRLLDLPDAVRHRVKEGQLSLGHGKLLAGVSDASAQARLADAVINQGLSVRNLERMIKAGETAPAPTGRVPRLAPSAHIQDLEKSLAVQLGLRVQVKASPRKGRGKLVLHYNSLEQFDELMGRLGLLIE